jgi:hypothetical protein
MLKTNIKQMQIFTGFKGKGEYKGDLPGYNL